MLNKKVILPTLALVSLGNAYIPQAQESVDLTKCVGSYNDQVNFLYMNCFDSQGRLSERYQRLFTRPLEQECSEVPRSSLVVPGGISPGPIVPVGPEVNNGTTNGTNTNTSAPTNGTDVNSTTPSNGTVVDNSTAPSNGTVVDNTTAPVSNGTEILNGTEIVSNLTEPVVNATETAVNNTVGTVNETIAEVNQTATDLNNTIANATDVLNGTTPIANGTDVNQTVSNGTDVNNGTSSNNGTTVDNSTSNGTDGGVTTAVQVKCCDFYEKGAGYEFSVCDQGIGAIIIPERIGGQRDIFWASQQPATFLGPIWTDLGNLVDNYCDARMNQTANSTANATSFDAGAAWKSLDLPWTQWRDDSLNTFADVALWLSRYTQYIGQAQAYLSENP